MTSMPVAIVMSQSNELVTNSRGHGAFHGHAFFARQAGKQLI
jgi:hypothetical protein